MNRFIVGSLIALGTMTSACNSADTAAEVQRDVADAQDARSDNVTEARRDGADAIQREQRDVTAERRDLEDATATRNYEVALSEAEGNLEVATQACEAMSGSEQTACKERADSVFETATARAEQLKPTL
jgi:hypothetical protein